MSDFLKIAALANQVLGVERKENDPASFAELAEPRGYMERMFLLIQEPIKWWGIRRGFEFTMEHLPDNSIVWYESSGPSTQAQPLQRLALRIDEDASPAKAWDRDYELTLSHHHTRTKTLPDDLTYNACRFHDKIVWEADRRERFLDDAGYIVDVALLRLPDQLPKQARKLTHPVFEFDLYYKCVDFVGGNFFDELPRFAIQERQSKVIYCGYFDEAEVALVREDEIYHSNREEISSRAIMGRMVALANSLALSIGKPVTIKLYMLWRWWKESPENDKFAKLLRETLAPGVKFYEGRYECSVDTGKGSDLRDVVYNTDRVTGLRESVRAMIWHRYEQAALKEDERELLAENPNMHPKVAELLAAHNKKG